MTEANPGRIRRSVRALLTLRSMRALLACVLVEAEVYFVVLLTRSGQDPSGCADTCWSDQDIAAVWGLGVVAPLAVGQLVFGGIAVALAARKGDRGIPTGLFAWFGATALTAALLFGTWFLQTT
ncbi:hypothetical protein [Streptomyces sp. SID13031]|uniref:hypothetical protein n=1 Tax=Streptomyces sp. SID13031 TaxID=2706046 RepID=UPI0013CB8D77|nr:hypothetical protein [Streptomyces sp. SID13031]NEA33691.1 hypothetical protein [Streptomyces sp. SID13031]